MCANQQLADMLTQGTFTNNPMEVFGAFVCQKRTAQIIFPAQHFRSISFCSVVASLSCHVDRLQLTAQLREGTPPSSDASRNAVRLTEATSSRVESSGSAGENSLRPFGTRRGEYRWISSRSWPGHNKRQHKRCTGSTH